MILIDTNILVYAHDVHSPFNKAAVQKLNALNEENEVLCISNQVIREYIAVVSKLLLRMGVYILSSVPNDVRLFERQYIVLEESTDTRKQLFKLLDDFIVGGKQVHDANLVATMLHYGISTILTHNVADFKRFDSLIKIMPLLEETN
jgi:predicted nucleic acid-binding protein